MNNILLASHGNLAIGLKNTVEFFLGDSKNIISVAAYIDSSDEYLKVINDFIDNVDEKDAIIFTDIFGGSVNQQVTTLVYNSGKKIPIIANMNLPIVMQLALSDEFNLLKLEEEINECLPKLVTLEIDDKEDELDDFFE